MTADIESLDHEGRGVTHVDGKVVFVEGALAGERVELETYRRKPKYDLAKTQVVLRASPSRTQPRCQSFGVCGGCAMQHLEPRAQVAAKQRVLEDNFAHIGQVRPEIMLAPIHGPAWGYRLRARFSSRYVHKRGTALVGFRERRHSFVADMQTCEVVPPKISALLMPLRSLVNSLSIRERVPQIELAVGEDRDALAFRILEKPSDEDQVCLREFADRHGVHVYLQPGGPDTVRLFHPAGDELLSYTLPDFDLEFRFGLTDFTQVNHQINRVLVRRALSLLQIQASERVADLFCGIGNFSLPIARRGARVSGFEGSETLIKRARSNARHNGLESACEFSEADLFKMDAEQWRDFGHFDKVLIDPPRDGAVELVKAIASDPPRRVVYVSCNPATLARDAAIMVHSNGYRLRAAGVVNMFPHTSHVESIAVFDK
ncbi:MAG: 23S rRNA (uracil(1939)-C(5))-methyltransferase RlmD [Betaproteobacteria bacterium]|nr:MAG: 23S rRNA (uracil(1939)-C(5))-methyltransferase RlmD [Betaproteobacteria bacterium]